MSFRRFDGQFRETEYERQQRWRQTRAKRTAEGKCWQCAKPVADCTCPNVKHAASPPVLTGEEQAVSSALATFIRYEMKRVMANICRAYAADNKPLPDELAVRLTVIEQVKSLKLAEVQEEDERKAG